MTAEAEQTTLLNKASEWLDIGCKVYAVVDNHVFKVKEIKEDDLIVVVHNQWGGAPYHIRHHYVTHYETHDHTTLETRSKAILEQWLRDHKVTAITELLSPTHKSIQHLNNPHTTAYTNSETVEVGVDETAIIIKLTRKRNESL